MLAVAVTQSDPLERYAPMSIRMLLTYTGCGNRRNGPAGARSGSTPGSKQRPYCGPSARQAHSKPMRPTTLRTVPTSRSVAESCVFRSTGRSVQNAKNAETIAAATAASYTTRRPASAVMAGLRRSSRVFSWRQRCTVRPAMRMSPAVAISRSIMGCAAGTRLRSRRSERQNQSGEARVGDTDCVSSSVFRAPLACHHAITRGETGPLRAGRSYQVGSLDGMMYLY